MKKGQLVLSIAAVIFFLDLTNVFPSNTQPVNSILGDVSFFSKFGYQPGAKTNEILRIRTHLEYVEQLLRNKDVSGLPPHLIKRRTILLNLLHEYSEAGIFPNNYDHKNQRIPCFIDREGKICAVGYLIEKTSGRIFAEQINLEHQYDLILEMNNDALRDWMESSGLTIEECAMIQPSYEERYGTSDADIIFSTTLTATNLTLGALNAVNASKNGINSTLQILGLITGTTQIIFGAASYPDKAYYDYGYSSKKSDKILSAVNMGIGASTVLLSIIGIIDNEKVKEKKTSWNIYGFPSKDQAGVGVSFSHKF